MSILYVIPRDSILVIKSLPCPGKRGNLLEHIGLSSKRSVYFENFNFVTSVNRFSNIVLKFETN